MHLVIFDVDGTLVQSMECDARAYLRTLEDVCGIVAVNPDWSSYRNSTDSGIFREAFERQIGRLPEDSDIATFQRHFLSRISAELDAVPLRPVLGAVETLRDLNASDATAVSMATGAWSESARLKLASAGIDFDSFPSATADDHEARSAIISLAIERAARAYSVASFDRAIYVGDGIWDARACRELSIPFLGVATGSSATQLRREGAIDVVSDLQRLDCVLCSHFADAA
jgi:phosphoglycolate phosphatase-like HAD superfamily hydrolase